jgi:hypothetical protein
MQGLLEKRGIIKHDVAKLIGNYINVFVLCESRTCIENTFWKALDLYKTKQPKHVVITFIHDWYVLKDIPWWVDLWKDVKKMLLLMKCNANFGECSSLDNNGALTFYATCIALAMTSPFKTTTRLQKGKRRSMQHKAHSK